MNSVEDFVSFIGMLVCLWVLRIEQSSPVKGGKMASVRCCFFLPPFMAAGCCVLLLPFVGVSLQCSLVHSWQTVCRGRFSAVHSSSSGFTFIISYPLAFHQSVPRLVSIVRGGIPAKHCSWSESMNHALTCNGNKSFSIWFVISG